MPKPNYHHARKQKELSRKARQLKKLQRRTGCPSGSEEASAPVQDPLAGPTNPILSDAT